MLAIGLMSGTSMDGVDCALLNTNGESVIETRGHVSLRYDPAFQAQLKLAEQLFFTHQGHPPHTPALDAIIQASTQWHQAAIEQLLRKQGLSRKSIDIIGYHGQTLFHHPSAGITVQVGNSQYLTDIFGVPVVSDFRQNDIQHGGQGAPLAPLYHQALAMRDNHCPIAIINCGGIANLTFITGPRYEDVFALDTGPGNALIDRYLKQKTAGQICMDTDGQYGLQGQVHPDVLALLFDHGCLSNGKNYFTLPAPKSLDINTLQLIPKLDQLSLDDACATLAAFTAKTIVHGLGQANTLIPELWVIAGGGAKNPVICRELSRHAAILKTADEMGWNAQTIEAELFAWLAVRSIKNLPLSIPQTTGVSQPVSGGRVFRPL